MRLHKRRFYLIIILIVVSLCPLSMRSQVKEPGVNITNPLGEAGKQPEILRLEPQGGVEGATITVVGKNLGEKLDDVKVLIGKKQKPVIPIILSAPDEKKIQHLRFTIPGDQGLLEGAAWGRRIQVRVTVKQQSSNDLPLKVIVPHWRRWNALLSILLVVIILGLLWWTFGKKEFWKKLVIDKQTNTYSLSKFQSLLWTAVFIGSYFYLAIGRGVILGKEIIPDFNSSLLGLMSISYGSLLLARGINSRRPKNDLTESPSHLRSLFSEGDEISLPRLQMLGFTIVGVVIYLYYLCNADLFSRGLPDIPPTLLLLMGVSQGGYIVSKFSRNLTVNYILPRRIQLKKRNETDALTIIGSGFSHGMKVFFPGRQELLDTEYVNANVLKVKQLPAFDKKGWQQLVVVPPGHSSSLAVEGGIEVVEDNN
ncbi:MAG: IPT/TIG domain-containing protein [Candidatus Aminicenantes bacterium]|nr:MAG: IPT/TIG domain-containing protein [Candidatus Aminicenantes bacterium]